ncbi:MAG: type II secretion system F family protein [Acidimicrobiia bacterium]
MSVEMLLAAGMGALVGLGAWLAITSIRGVRVLPEAHRLVPAAVPAQRAVAWLSAAAVTGLVVGMVTGWPVAGLAAGVGVLFGPAALGGGSRRRGETQTAEAIATWADMIRDTMAGASGLEESLIQTGAVAPAAIAGQVSTFTHRLRHQSLDDALTGLAADLDHPSADLLCAALAAAGRLEARDLGGLLARLAEAIRGDVRMRIRVEVGRARIRTSARIAVGTTVATVVFLYLFARHLLEPYDTLAGQGWLVVVAAVFFGAGVMLHRYSHLEVPERFTLRQDSRTEVPTP